MKLIATAIPALLLAGIAAYFLYSHRSRGEQPLVYHHSWSPQRRADLDQLYTLMANRSSEQLPPELAQLRDARRKQEDRAICDMLRRVAASGRGDICTDTGITAAHIAAHMSKADLLRELILSGISPNSIQKSDPTGPESVFQTAIACSSFVPDTPRLSQAERLELLDWLLDHGADVNLNSDYSLTLALLADMTDEWQHDEYSIPGATTEWLLDHGLKPQGEHAHAQIVKVILLRGSLPCVRRLAEKGYLNLQDTQELNTLLAEASTTTETDSAEKARWLLALGADPTTALPACCANIRLYGDSDDMDDAPCFNSALQVLDALMDYGAQLDDPAHTCPKAEPQKSAFLDLLQSHTKNSSPPPL